MARCARTRNLEVHHKRRDGGNRISNAVVLCQKCHAQTSTYGLSGRTPRPFDEATKVRALRNANNRCQCTSTRGCH